MIAKSWPITPLGIVPAMPAWYCLRLANRSASFALRTSLHLRTQALAIGQMLALILEALQSALVHLLRKCMSNSRGTLSAEFGHHRKHHLAHSAICKTHEKETLCSGQHEPAVSRSGHVQHEPKLEACPRSQATGNTKNV